MSAYAHKHMIYLLSSTKPSFGILEMTRYVTYCRVSTQSQGRSGLGLEAQQRDIDLFLASQDNAEVIHSFIEVESGKDDANRPKLQEALSVARKTKATLLVSKLCRLSRDAAYILALMKDSSVQFKVSTMPNADNFQLGIYALLNQQEREQISARTKAALAAAKARGTVLGAKGRENLASINKNRKHDAIRQAEKIAPIVVPLRKSGQTLQQIADTLNAMGYTTTQGKHFHPYTVSLVLSRVS